VPPTINAFLSFVAPVTYHHPKSTNTKLRIFGVELTVFDKMIEEQSTYSTFQLLCIFPNTPRWIKFNRSPALGGYVQVTGELVGLYKIRNQRSLCTIIHEISFLPALSKPKSMTSTGPSAISPETPRKRLRRRGEQFTGQQQTPSKRRRQESPIVRDSSEEIIVCSTQTEQVPNTGDSQHGSSSKGKERASGRQRKTPKKFG
jgi:hypothetical protein